MKTTIVKVGAVLALAAGVGLAVPTAATADTYPSSSSVSSTTAWKIGENPYFQTHNGDDFGLDVTSGISIDARWASCKIGGSTGAIKYNIRAAATLRTIGTNFLAGTCLKTQYRGYSTTGRFTSTQYYNFNFV